MSRSRRVGGTCCICGQEGPLTFEHVPPRAAFNDRPVLELAFDAILKMEPGKDPEGGKIRQRGAGAYALCEVCNNRTGAWFSSDFAYWCHQGMDLLLRTGGEPTLCYPFRIYPLRVIKQILAIFCSTNGPGFARRNQDIAALLLSKERRFLSPDFGVFAYLNLRGGSRQTGITSILRLDASPSVVTLNEFCFPPFGYVLTMGSPPPEPQLVDISFFSKYGYDDFRTFYMSFPVLETHLALPGDYRSLDQILEARRQNKARE